MWLSPLEQVDPKRGSLGPARELVGWARARLGVPEGAALLWEDLRELLRQAEVREPWAWSAGLNEGAAELPPSADVLAAALSELGEELEPLCGRFEGLGSSHAIVQAYVDADGLFEPVTTWEGILSLTRAADVREALARALYAVYDRERLAALLRAGATRLSITLTVQRVVEGSVAGVAYTRHPLTGDATEWLLRAGYGLSGAVRRGEVSSDVWRVRRDQRVRDVVVVDKPSQMIIDPDTTSLSIGPVPEAARRRPALSEPLLAEVLRLAGRVERHAGGPVSFDWAVAEGKVYLLRASPLGARGRPERSRSKGADTELWSDREVCEAVSDVPCPLTWSLLSRFSRLGVARLLSAVGARVGEDALLIDVRGRPYLNVGALTAAACRLPFVGPRQLLDVGLEPTLDLVADPLSTLGLTRAALSIYDTQIRFGARLAPLSDSLRVQQGHFSPLDPRLLSPDAMERVLCDVESWLEGAGTALMRCYGLWLSSLLALRAIFARHADDDAHRLEGDLLWGAEEVGPVALTREALALASRHAEAACSSAPSQDFMREVSGLLAGHRHSGFVLMDPESPRWCEQLTLVAGVLWRVAGDAPTQALATGRLEIARGRRERAEREWRRRIPLLYRPIVQLLIERVRALTKWREELLLDCAQGVRVLREIALDTSRRMSLQDPTLPAGSAFFLELTELHELLAGPRFALASRTLQRRTEQRVLASLPRAAARFAVRAREVAPAIGALKGVEGSTGTVEGVVARVTTPEALSRVPAGAVLVVRACDVGLAPLLPAARAIVSQGGGRLSHGVMLGRALGMPSVVGVEGALARLRDGQRVRVDADRAEVTVLE